MTKRTTFTVKVDEDVANSFREFVQETKGQIRGELGREVENALNEYMDNDRLTRVEGRLDTLPEEIAEAVVRELDEKKKNSADSSSTDSGPESTTMNRLEQIAAELPPNTTVSADMLETPIEKIAGSSADTVRKYKRLLSKHGHVINKPVSGEEEFFTSARTFALWCENNPGVTPQNISDFNDRLADTLGEEWYMDALPDDFVANQPLKAEDVATIAVDEYRREHGMTTDERGFQ